MWEESRRHQINSSLVHWNLLIPGQPGADWYWQNSGKTKEWRRCQTYGTSPKHYFLGKIKGTRKCKIGCFSFITKKVILVISA